MKPMKPSFFARFPILLFVLSCDLPGLVQAAPGPLAQVPLYLSISVQPNIFFVLDDSGSMDWEVLKSAGAQTAHPSLPENVYVEFGFGVNLEKGGRLCHGYNVLAYDPNKKYTPWVGEDTAGVPFADLELDEARTNPSDPSSVIDLTNVGFYVTWNDADGDGQYDSGECNLPVSCFMPDLFLSAADCGTTCSRCVKASGLSADDKVNFANWYSYYRKREYVLKRAVGPLIATATQRMGMSSIGNTGSLSTPVRDMSDDTATSPCGGGMSNRDCLLERLYLMDAGSGGNTPLRRALAQAGQYFHQDDSDDHEYLGGEPSPILSLAEGGNCQQNYSIVVSDGFWNGVLPGGDSVGDADSDGDHDEPGETNGMAPPPWDGGAQADANPAIIPANCDDPSDAQTSDTLADIAMHYYEQDLSSTLPDDLSVITGVDENKRQHMVTYTVAFGVQGSLTESQIASIFNGQDRSDPFDWPAVCPDSPSTVDDMVHAAWNGRGDFLSARDPDQVAAKLKDIVSAISDRQITAAPVTFTTNRITAESLAFVTEVNTERWSGDVVAYNAEDLLDYLISGAPLSGEEWRATEWVDYNDPSLRQVLTLGTSNTGAAATWANLTADQQNDLRIDADGNLGSEASGQERLDYLLGSRDCELGASGDCTTDIDGDGQTGADDKLLRSRASRLGDFINSTPVFVGAPSLDWPSEDDFAGYDEFKSDKASRPKVVYVGGNDGMLHGFYTEDTPDDGQEALAYMPASLASSAPDDGYHFLSDRYYSHRYYVDLTPSVSDVLIHGAWETVLIGALGGGGTGLFALKITDPTTFDATNASDLVLWEFSKADDPELANTFSRPIVAFMNNIEWAVIAGSGYNDGPIPDDSTEDPNAYLFILFIEKGEDGSWGQVGDYVRIEAPEPLATKSNPNGLSSPVVVDANGDSIADRIYAGDLFGNLWGFNVEGDSPSGWSAYKIFTAGSGQPITVQPTVAKHPFVPDFDDNQPNMMVYFGTGQYLVLDDPKNEDQQSFYGIWDRNSIDLTRSHLQAQYFDPNFANDVVLTDNAVDWETQSGWYIDLPDAGERVVVDPVLQGDLLFFNSLVPDPQVCTAGGTSFQYVVSTENGGPPEEPAFDFNGLDGLTDEDVVTSIDGSTQENPSRVSFNDGQGIATRPVIVDYNGDYRMLTGIVGGDPDCDDPACRIEDKDIADLMTLDGRISWQELIRF